MTMFTVLSLPFLRVATCVGAGPFVVGFLLAAQENNKLFHHTTAEGHFALLNRVIYMFKVHYPLLGETLCECVTV